MTASPRCAHDDSRRSFAGDERIGSARGRPDHAPGLRDLRATDLGPAPWTPATRPSPQDSRAPTSSSRDHSTSTSTLVGGVKDGRASTPGAWGLPLTHHRRRPAPRMGWTGWGSGLLEGTGSRARRGGAKRWDGHPGQGVTVPRHGVRRRPTLPRSFPRSTIGADRLSFRVRNETGRFPVAMAAVTLWRWRAEADRSPGTAQWTRAHKKSCGKLSAY